MKTRQNGLTYLRGGYALIILALVNISALTLAFNSTCAETPLSGSSVFRVYSAETLMPLRGVTVTVFPAGQAGGESNKNGFVDRQVLAEFSQVDSVLFSRVGYESQWLSFGSSEGIAETQHIYLTPTELTMQKIVVTGSRAPRLLKEVPVSTEVISSADIEKIGALNVAEALRFSSGIKMDEDFSGDGISIRGVDPSRVLLLVDGRRVIGRINGSIDLGQFSVANIERIEVVKGVGSTLYGSDALGGVINIITKSGSADHQLATAVSFGSYNQSDPYLQYSKNLENAHWNIGAAFHSNSPIDLDKSSLHTNGREGVDRYNIDGTYERQINKLTLTSRLSLMAEDKNWTESVVFPGLGEVVFDDIEENRRLSFNIEGKRFSSPSFQMEFSAGGSIYDHKWIKYTKTGKIDSESRSDEASYEGSILARHLFSGGGVLTTGVDGVRQRLTSAQLASGEERVVLIGAFSQYETKAPGGFTVLPGVRLESHSNFGSFLSPSLNVMLDISERYRLRGFVGRGFRAPSIKEQYFEFNHSTEGYLVIGNENLKPETSINSSLSLEISQGEHAEYRFTYFYNHLENLIEFDSIGNTPEFPIGIYEFRNVSSAYTTGLEFESSWRFQRFASLSITYDYLKAVDLSTAADLKNRANHAGSFFLSLHRLPLGMTGAIWGQYEGGKIVELRFQPEEDRDGSEINRRAPSYFPFGFSLARKLGKGLTLSGKMENVTDDTDWRLGRNSPRSVSVRLSYNGK